MKACTVFREWHKMAAVTFLWRAFRELSSICYVDTNERNYFHKIWKQQTQPKTIKMNEAWHGYGIWIYKSVPTWTHSQNLAVATVEAPNLNILSCRISLKWSQRPNQNDYNQNLSCIKKHTSLKVAIAIFFSDWMFVV